MREAIRSGGRGQKLLITSPLDMYVEKVVAAPGTVKAGSTLLVLDHRELEKNLARQQSMAELLKIKAERLEEPYVEEFVFAPLRSHQSLMRRSVEVLVETLKQTRDRFNVGEVTRTDVAFAEAAVAQGQGDHLKASDDLDKKVVKLDKQRSIQQAVEGRVAAEIDILKLQISRRTVLAPWNGNLKILTASGVFVEEGDVLAELSS